MEEQKVTISLNYIEQLKKQIEDLENENKRLKLELSLLDPDNIKINALKLSYNLSDSFLKKVFTKLGFTLDNRYSVFGSVNMPKHINKLYWWEEAESLNVEIGAFITNNFRDAFINIGVVEKKTKS